MTVMDRQTYRTHSLKRGSLQELTNALADNGDVAFFFRSEGQEVIYAVAGRCGDLRPLWAVLAAGYPTSEVYTTRNPETNSAEKGLLDYIMSVNDARPKALVFKSESAEKAFAKVRWFNEARMDLTASLAGLYPVLPGQQALVGDIQAENASVKADGKITAAGTRTVHRMYMAAAFTLLRHKHTSGDRDGVVALVVDKTGNIISWGQKNPGVTCWHGETSAILRLGGTLPAGCCIYSTLKPCLMCSGLIYSASKGTAKVFWGQHDPGRSAEGTVLDSQKKGQVLDGHKDHKNVARALIVGNNKSSLAKTLQTSFERQQYKPSGERSTIDYITTDATKNFLIQAQDALVNKFNKYNKPDAPEGNKNTQQVVNYLIRFLRDAAKVNGI